MKKLSILLLLLSYVPVFTQVDSLFFIGEVRWGLKHKDNGELGARIPYKEYVNELKYKIGSLYTMNGKRRIQFTAKERKKESYYGGQEINCVEIRIGIPVEALSEENSSLQTEGYIDVKGIKNKKRINPFTITRPSKYSADYINSNTYKLQDPIEISFPEEISLSVIMAYVNNKLYTLSDSVGGFLPTIKSLEAFNYSVERKLSYNELINLYKLLTFIEPFAKKEAFLHSEAEQLKLQLNILEQKLKDSNFTSTLSSDSLTALTEDFATSTNIYNNYFTFSKALQTYYDQLKTIMLLETPVQKQTYLEKRSKFRIGLGPGGVYDYFDTYDITTSSIDTTVQFQKLSKMNPVIATGLFFEIESKRRDSISPFSFQKNKRSYCVGMTINYYVAQSMQNAKISFPLGLGVSFGQRYNNFLISLSVNVRRYRSPRDYFKNEFLGSNKKIFLNGSTTPSSVVDYGNNNLFIDKYGYSVGLSIFYTINWQH